MSGLPEHRTVPLRVIESDQPVSRSCGGCQACCVVHDIWPTDDLTAGPPLSSAWESCRHQCVRGCAVYASRPGPCATYRCMWLLGWAGEDWRPDKLGLVVEGNPQSPDLVVVTEAWPDAHKSDKAQEVLYTLRVQVPCVVVCPWGHVSDDPSTPDLMLMDPPAWVLARMRSVSPQAKPRDSR